MTQQSLLLLVTSPGDGVCRADDLGDRPRGRSAVQGESTHRPEAAELNLWVVDVDGVSHGEWMVNDGDGGDTAAC